MRKVVQLILMLLMIGGIFSMSVAGPANTEPVTVTQPDGTTITIRAFGDEWFGWAETLDGYTVMRNSEGWVVYALQGTNGQLEPSSVIARNEDERSAAELQFLNSVGEKVRPSTEVMQTIMDFKRNNFYDELGEKLNVLKKAAGVTGTWKVCVILFEFPDLAHQAANTTTVFQNMWNQAGWEGGIGSPGSINDFFKESSYNQFGIEASVYGWYTSTNNSSYYAWSNTDNWERARALAAEIINKANTDVNFAQFDNNGDGTVEGVVLVHAGPGAAEGGNLNYIWPHKWNLATALNLDGKRISTYTLQEEIQYNRLTGIGMMCHEYSHALGLIDLYDTDGSSEGIGNWGLMAGASWLNQGRTPAHHSPYSKEILGWITPSVVTANGTYTFNEITANNNYYKIRTSAANEYFLIENRQKTGFNSYVPGSGLLLWHIDKNMTVNSDENHKLVDLEEADGLAGLDKKTNRGDTGDPFPGSSGNRTFNNTTNPNSKNYAGANTGIEVSSISNSGNSMTAYIVVPGGGTVNLPPVAKANGPYTSQPAQAVNFSSAGSNDPDGSIASYSWNFGDGTTSTLANPSKTYSVIGKYKTILTVTDNNGLLDADTTNVFITDTDSIFVVGDERILDMVTTTATNRRAQSFIMPQNGTIKSVAMYHDGGTGNMLLAVYEGDSAPTNRLAVTSVTAVSSVTGWQTIALEQSVYVPKDKKIWLTWVYETNPGIYYTAGTPGRADAGTGWAGGMPAVFGTSTFADFIYTIYANYTKSTNQPPVAEANGPYTGRVGSSISFSSNGSSDPDGSIVSYLWNFGDGTTSTLANPSKSYSTAGTFNVTLTVTDDKNTAATDNTNAVISDTVTSVDNTNKIPTEYALNNPYPNPFNPGTNVKFVLPKDEMVNLVVYNILGEAVRVLANNKPHDAGEHNYYWNGKDNYNQVLPSGVYIIQIRAGSFIKSVKAILLK